MDLSAQSLRGSLLLFWEGPLTTKVFAAMEACTVNPTQQISHKNEMLRVRRNTDTALLERVEIGEDMGGYWKGNNPKLGINPESDLWLGKRSAGLRETNAIFSIPNPPSAADEVLKPSMKLRKPGETRC